VLGDNVLTYAGLFASFDSIDIEPGGGVHAISIQDLPANIPVNILGSLSDDIVILTSVSGSAGVNFFGASGNDVLTLAPGGAFQAIRSPVTFFGGDNNDVANLAPDAPFGTAAIDAPFTFHGGNHSDVLNVGSGNLDAVTAPITFNGGDTSIADRVILNDQVPVLFYTYNVTPNAVTRNPLFGGLTYSNISRIIINCGPGANTVNIGNISPVVEAYGNDGPDTFVTGGGMITTSFGHILNGGNGIDQVTFDDRLNTGNRTWEINTNFNPNEIVYSGIILLDTTGFESVGVIAGLGNDTISFFNDIRRNFNVNGGGGSDTFVWNAANNWYRNPKGGDITRYNATLDGGAPGEFNVMIVNDQPRSETGYFFQNDYFIGVDGDAPVRGEEITYADFWSFSVNASDQSNHFDVRSVDPATSYSLFGFGGPDVFQIRTSPTGGGFVRCSGGPGIDTVIIDDQTFGDDADYTTGLSLISRVASAPGRRGTIETRFTIDTSESVSITGTAGTNVFTVPGLDVNRPLTVSGAGGDDTVIVNGAALGNAFPTSLTVHGNDGYDTMVMSDAAVTAATGYDLVAGTFQRNDTNVPHTTLERIDINAGSGNDDTVIFSMDPGLLLVVSAGDGDDRLFTGALTAGGVRGPVQFFGEGGADNRVILNDVIDTTGDTVHIDQQTVGAFPGDDFFGDGGSLYFADAQRIDVTLGPGADVVYAQPNLNAILNIDGSGLAGSPEDSLNLALANATNYVITPGAPGAGTVTSDNAQPLNWTSIENEPLLDDVAPEVLSSSFDLDVPQQSITMNFSEDVSGTLLSGSILLTNLTTNETINPTDISLAYDTSTNTATFTFPNFANGALPDGSYQLFLAAGAVTDLFGNALVADHTLDFFFLQGDANHDGRVNLQDFNILAINFGQSDRLFSQADFNYDGTVNLQDFNILAIQFGATLEDLMRRETLPAPREDTMDERPQ
jgi:hypothetical protein